MNRKGFGGGFREDMFIPLVVVLICFIILAGYFMVKYQNNKLGEEQADAWWHMGYKSCEMNFNYTSEEQMMINEYRIKQWVDKDGN